MFRVEKRGFREFKDGPRGFFELDSTVVEARVVT
jgi:hypothetical protein